MVNAYITHKEAAKMSNKAKDFANVTIRSPAGRAARKRNKAAAHALLQEDDWVTVSVSLLRGERKKSF
jgi:hypothetical protein